MAKSWIDEFNRRYNQPQVDKVTVGFSGIDPAPKSIFDGTTSSGEPVPIIIDGGEITLDDGPINVDSGEITLP